MRSTITSAFCLKTCFSTQCRVTQSMKILLSLGVRDRNSGKISWLNFRIIRIRVLNGESVLENWSEMITKFCGMHTYGELHRPSKEWLQSNKLNNSHRAARHRVLTHQHEHFLFNYGGCSVKTSKQPCIGSRANLGLYYKAFLDPP